MGHPPWLFFINMSPRKSISFTTPWYDPMVNTVILPTSLRQKHTRKWSFQNWRQTNIVYQKHTCLVKKLTSQKYGQIVPTPRGSILPHTKPSQVPYNAQNRFLGVSAISSNIPYYSLLFPRESVGITANNYLITSWSLEDAPSMRLWCVYMRCLCVYICFSDLF